MTVRANIKFLRFMGLNGRSVAMAQLFHEDGTKLFPQPVHRAVDATLSQLLEYVEQNGIEVENALEILDVIVRANRFAS